MYARMFTGMAIIVAMAWVFHFQVALPPVLKASGWLLGLALWAYGYWGVLLQLKESPLHPALPMAGVMLFAFMPQVLSKDLYIYLLQGKLALKGIFTYTDGNLNAQHEWVQYVDPQWADCPNHYGPVPTLLFALVALMPSLWGATILLKCLFVAIAQLIIAFIPFASIGRTMLIDEQKQRIAVAGLAFNPIFLIQGVGQMHIDLLTCLFVMLFVLTVTMLDGWKAKALSIALLGATKLLLFPIFLAFWALVSIWYKRHGVAINWRVPVGATVLLAAMYLPIWQGTATITHPLSYHENKEPVKSVTELLAYGAAYLVPVSEASILASQKNEQQSTARAESASSPLASAGVRSRDPLLAQKVYYGRLIAPFMKVLALALGLFLAWRLLRLLSHVQVLWLLGLMLLAVFIVYSPIMHPWYFLLVLPFLAVYADDRTVALYLTITFTLSCAYEAGQWLTGSWGAALTIGGTVLAVLAYFIGFKKWFLTKEKIWRADA